MKKKVLFSFILLIIIIVCINLLKSTDVIVNTETQQQEESWYEDGITEEIARPFGCFVHPSYADVSTLAKVYENYKKIENNEFVNKYIKIYEDMELDKISNFEEDLLLIYTKTKYSKNEYSIFDNLNYVERIWKIGYDENNNFVNREDNKFMRIICFLTNDKAKKYYYRVSITNTNGFYIQKWSSPEHLGIDTNTDIGICNTGGWEKYIDNTNYVKVEKSEINNIITKYSKLLSLLDEYHDNCYISYVEEINNEYREKNTKKEPKIGMTEAEVRNSTWGSPDDINTDTYSWGTTEQWVYDNKGYIYFKNGKVTSISER